jgi:hypothetical protein
MWCCTAYGYHFVAHAEINDGAPCENTIWIAGYLFNCFVNP